MNGASERVYDIADEVMPHEAEVAMGNTIYETVYELFKKQVAEQAPKKISLLNAETPFDDVGMDSLEKLSVAMDLEDHFDLFIPDEDVAIFTNIQDVVNYLELAITKKAMHPVVGNLPGEAQSDQDLSDNVLSDEVLSDKSQADRIGSADSEK